MAKFLEKKIHTDNLAKDTLDSLGKKLLWNPKRTSDKEQHFVPSNLQPVGGDDRYGDCGKNRSCN